jgi:hypothetical protein
VLFAHSGAGSVNYGDSYSSVNGLNVSLGFRFGVAGTNVYSATIGRDGDLWLGAYRVSVYYLDRSYASIRPYMYRSETNTTRLRELTDRIANSNFGNISSGFWIRNAFVITWHRYGNASAWNSFQVILATDGVNSFLMFIYENLQIVSANAPPMFFDLGLIKWSMWVRTVDTNCNVPGLFIFKVDQQGEFNFYSLF